MTRLRPVGPRGDLDDVTGRTDDAGVEPSVGRLLSVAELQQALHLARAAASVSVVPKSAPVFSPGQWIDPLGCRELSHEEPDLAVGEVAPAAASARRAACPAPYPATGLGETEPLTIGPAAAPRPNGATGWVAVVGAHGGAGASTVALALADALAAQGRRVHLISQSAQGQCGLLAVTAVELGVSDDGQWRRGRRGTQMTVDRCNDRASHQNVVATSWPPLESARSGQEAVTVVDLGEADELTPLPLASAAAVLVVCRVTVPGVQHAERIVSALRHPGGRDHPDRPVLLACIGPRRWPGVVNGSVGPRVRQLHRNGHIVTVPVDRKLERTGLTGAPLPKAVTAAGRALLRLLEPALATLPPVAAAPADSSPLPRVAVRPAAGAGAWPGDLTAKDHCG